MIGRPNSRWRIFSVADAVRSGVAVLCFLSFLARPVFSPAAEDPEPADPWDPAQTRLLRNPFLPPGYVASEASTFRGDLASARDDASWVAAEAQLSVRGISQMKSGVAALIGNRVVSVGDIVETEMNGQRYCWRVTQLDMQTGIVLERLPLGKSVEPAEATPPDFETS